MRTTLAIDDGLLRSAKEQARARGLTLGQLVEEALRRELSHRASAPPGPHIPVFRGGTGVRPGVDIDSNRAVLEVLDEGEPLEHLR